MLFGLIPEELSMGWWRHCFTSQNVIKSFNCGVSNISVMSATAIFVTITQYHGEDIFASILPLYMYTL